MHVVLARQQAHHRRDDMVEPPGVDDGQVEQDAHAHTVRDHGLGGVNEVAESYPARFAALSTARTDAVAISASIPTPNTVRPSAVRHST